METGVIDFLFDVACPFAYLASTRIEAVAARAGARVRWRPVLLGGLLRATGAPDDPNAVMPPAKRALVRLDMLRQADVLGVPLTIPDAHPRRTLDAMRWLVATPDDALPALAARLFRAYWVEGADVADRAVLRAIGAEQGVDVDRIVDDAETRALLRARTDEAVARGAFGVPTVFVGEQRVWGADRLWQVEQALGLPVPPAVAGTASGGTLEWFHDFASPFSYLASTQIRAVADQLGAELVQTPVLVGALFQAIGTPMVPVATFSQAKADHVGRDLAAWAARYGVPFRFASNFPIRTLHADRVALVAPAVTDAVYRAAWADDRDVATPEGLRAVLDDAGFDGADLLARAEDPAVKAQLRANTERAVALGVCGVPTFRVGDQLFWGQDRLDHVARALGGWRVDDPGSAA
ncbi:MAG: 2-hydroxychromene-2-carboxylate isomerase [Myxococcota bacterium]